MAKERVEDGTGEPDGNRAVTDHKPSASLWPMFVAFGLAIAEVGVVVGVFVLTVVGFLMFTGAVTGILYESGYVESPWQTLGVLASVVLALGFGVFLGFGGVVGGAELVAVNVTPAAHQSPLQNLGKGIDAVGAMLLEHHHGPFVGKELLGHSHIEAFQGPVQDFLVNTVPVFGQQAGDVRNGNPDHRISHCW